MKTIFMGLTIVVALFQSARSWGHSFLGVPFIASQSVTPSYNYDNYFVMFYIWLFYKAGDNAGGWGVTNYLLNPDCNNPKIDKRKTPNQQTTKKAFKPRRPFCDYKRDN